MVNHLRRNLAVVIVLSLIFGLVPVAFAQDDGLLAASFDRPLALTQANDESAGGVILLPVDGTIATAYRSNASKSADVLGWRGETALFVAGQPDGAQHIIAVQHGERTVLAEGLPADTAYALTPDGSTIIGWSTGAFNEVALYQADDPTLPAVTWNTSDNMMQNVSLVGFVGDVAYFGSGNALMTLNLTDGTMTALQPVLPGPEAIVTTMGIDGNPLYIVGRNDPKDLSVIHSVIPNADHSFDPAAVTMHLLPIGEAQRIQPSPDGSLHAVVGTVPGDFSGSNIAIADAAIAGIQGNVARAAYNSCPIFTPDGQAVLFVSENGLSLMAASTADLAIQETLYSSAMPLDLCGAVWQQSTMPEQAAVNQTPSEDGDMMDTIDDETPFQSYPLALTAGETVTITMERISGDLDAFLILLGPDGMEVARNDDASEIIGDTAMNAQILNYTATSDGEHTIQATRFFQENGPSSGAFRLTVDHGEFVPVIVPTEAPAIEPTADFATETPIVDINLEVGSEVSGVIDNTIPSTTYMITLQEGETVTFTMLRTSGDLDPYLQLWDMNGQIVAENDDAETIVGNSNLNAQIAAFVAPATGTYVVQATRYEIEDGLSTGAYTLSVEAAEAPPETVLIEGTTLSVGSVVNGTLSDGQYTIAYTLPLENGQSVTVTMVGTDGDLDPYLSILGPDGAELAINDDAAPSVGGNTLNAQIQDFVAPETGTYTVVASRFSGDTGLSSGGYELRIDASTATAITGGGRIMPGETLAGSINNATVAEVYTLPLNAGDNITITMLQTSGDLDAYLQLLAPDGSELASNDDTIQSISDNSFDAQIAGYIAPESGTYTIIATRFAQEDGVSQGSYSISVEAGTASAPTPGHALMIGDTVSNTITDGEPSIAYTVTLEAGQIVTISMERTSSDLDPYLIILDPNGNEAAANDDAETQFGDSLFNAQIVDFVALESGTYTIIATRYAQENGASQGQFLLSIQTQAEGTALGPIMTSGELRLGDSVVGTISQAQPVTNYSLVLEAGQTVTISMERTSGDLDTLLRLVNASGFEVAFNDDAVISVGDTSLNAQIANFTAPSSGTYTIQATRYGEADGASQGDYQISITSENTVITTPGGVLRVGDVVQGEINDAQFQIDYTITLEAGQAVSITMEAIRGDLDTYLSILGPNGRELAFNDDAATIVSGNSLNAQVTNFTAATSGEYIIRATRYNQREGGTNGGFQLTVSSTAASPAGAITIENGVAYAPPVTINATVSGDIGSENYAVEYPITLNTGDTIALTAQATSGDLDTLLVIYNTDNDAVAYNDDAPTQVGESQYNSHIISFTAPSSGEYYIFLTRYDWEDGDTEGSFTLQVDTAIPVRAETAAPVAIGDIVSSAISEEVYAVDYPITLTEGSVITVTMLALDDTLDPSLIIYDAAGNELAYNDDAESDFGSGLDAEILGFVAPASGSYTIRATRYFESGGSSYGQFELEVRAGGEPEAGPSK